jgi:WD40 repeat protein
LRIFFRRAFSIISSINLQFVIFIFSFLCFSISFLYLYLIHSPCSHGRDNSLKVWQLRQADESTFSTTLPVEDTTTHRTEPWLLHSLSVNTLNFCAFAKCFTQTSSAAEESTTGRTPILIAVPGLQEGFVNIMQLPSEDRLHTIPPAKEAKGGMIMALRIFYKDDVLHLITGHESGITTLQIFSSERWQTIYSSESHTQPILSLDISPTLESWYSSGADSIIAMHSIPISQPSLSSKKPQKASSSYSDGESKTIQTKHSGQQSLTVRSDGKIFATAGWDSRIRVYSAKTLKEVAVLKWHKEGCYAVAFAEILQTASLKNTHHEARSAGEKSEGTEVVRREEAGAVVTADKTVKQRREDKARETHWLSAGSKDGKVSLWEIY